MQVNSWSVQGVIFIQRDSRTAVEEIIAEEVAKVHCAFIYTSLLSREAKRVCVVSRCRSRSGGKIIKL